MKLIDPMKIIASADDFLEASNRCNFPDGKITEDNLPLLVPGFVNCAFACELYLKAIALMKNSNTAKGHRLDKLFYSLDKGVQQQIYDLWLEQAGENIVDCDYIKKMFFDNLESVGNVFAKFRYVHEWSSTNISIPHSYTNDQYYLIFNSNTYSGFLKQFAYVLKAYSQALDS